MKTLNELKDLGVTTLSVTNGLATAVNPYVKYKTSKRADDGPSFKWRTFDALNLPPLPTSGIPDGLVGIDEVEPVQQYFSNSPGIGWTTPILKPIEFYAEHGCAIRTALRKKSKLIAQ